jgi:hypothetical protein
VGSGAPVYLAAVLEYLAAEVSSFLSIVFRLSLYLDTTDFESALSPISSVLLVSFGKHAQSKTLHVHVVIGTELHNLLILHNHMLVYQYH